VSFLCLYPPKTKRQRFEPPPNPPLPFVKSGGNHIQPVFICFFYFNRLTTTGFPTKCAPFSCLWTAKTYIVTNAQCPPFPLFPVKLSTFGVLSSPSKRNYYLRCLRQLEKPTLYPDKSRTLSCGTLEIFQRPTLILSCQLLPLFSLSASFEWLKNVTQRNFSFGL